MKIQAIKKDIKSMKLSVPVDGLIDIDENGIAEVSSKCGKMLIEGTNDWKEYKAGKDAEEPEDDDEQAENDVEEAEDADDTDENDEKKQPTDKEVIDGLNNLSLEDCIATAKEAGYPAKEWEKLSKNEKAAERLMRQYLVKKYKSSIK